MKCFKYYNKQLHLWFYVAVVNRREIEGVGRFEHTALQRLNVKLGEAMQPQVSKEEFTIIDTRTWVPLAELKEKFLEVVEPLALPLNRLNLSDPLNISWLERNLTDQEALKILSQIKSGGRI